MLMCICIDRFLNSINFLRRFQHKCQSFKWTRFEIIATLHCSLPRWFSIQAYIGFHVVDIINRRSLFIPLWLSTGNTFKSAFVSLMVSNPERTNT